MGSRIWTAVGTKEKTFQEMMSMKQLIPEYKDYLGLWSLGINPNLH